MSVGRQAVEKNKNDAWAIHAVAHVLEMTNGVDEGERWLRASESDWVSSNLAVHIWWHLALYYCDQQRWDSGALDLYDARIRRPASTVVMELLDASSLLWRLNLYDVDIGDRWLGLSDAWESRVDEAWYVFNDMHAMMAFAGARRFDLAQRLVAALTTVADARSENGLVTRAIGRRPRTRPPGRRYRPRRRARPGAACVRWPRAAPRPRTGRRHRIRAPRGRPGRRAAAPNAPDKSSRHAKNPLCSRVVRPGGACPGGR